MVKIVCACKKLVEVLNKCISYHVLPSGEPCPASGMRYISKRSSPPGMPGFEAVAQGPIDCPMCGEAGHSIGVIVRHVGNPEMN